MFGKRIHLFTLYGFKVRVDLSWVILAVLITWSLAKGLFPKYFGGFSEATYWWMGLAGALGLFASIVFHEFCHSIVARQFGLQMKGITLFIFGGVAEMTREPENPKSEFLMAAAGPLSSVVLAGLLHLVFRAGGKIGWPGPVNAVLQYYVWLNLVLAAFNLVPAFPLDGGRILRSILWAVKGNLRWATRVASRLGAAFGLFLIVVGVINFVGGSFIGGLWYCLIGMFIRGASQTSYRQLLMRKAFTGEQISQFMQTNPVTVSCRVPVDRLVHEYFYRHHYKMFPVCDDGRVTGCISTKEVKEIPKEQWGRYTVADIAEASHSDNTVSPDTDAMQALSIMNRTGNSRLMVVVGDKLVGIITLKDLLKFLALKIDLEEDEQIRVPE